MNRGGYNSSLVISPKSSDNILERVGLSLSLTLMSALQETDAVHQPPLPGLSLSQHATNIQELPGAQVRMMTTP